MSELLQFVESRLLPAPRHALVAARRGARRRVNRRQQQGFWRGLFILLLLGLAVAVAIAAWAFRDYQRFLESPLASSGEARVIEIARGTSFRGVLAQLQAEGLDAGAPLLYWRALAWRHKALVQAGEYRLETRLTPLQLLEKLRRGEVLQYRFTIVEGWTLHELRLALARDPVLIQTLGGIPEDELLDRLGIDLELAGAGFGPSPEGLFLPETYQFTRGTSDAELLRRAHRALLDVLDAAWKARAAELPLVSPYQALVLASIVEKETGLPDERAQVAGVFVRRLRLGMRLQTDPTVIYGLGPDFSGRLTRAHLEADTPHNTYTRAGLPPTPIALPGRAAIEASLHPDVGDALYFVARGEGAGHVFSRTLEEHNRAVAEYRRRMRAR